VATEGRFFRTTRLLVRRAFALATAVTTLAIAVSSCRRTDIVAERNQEEASDAGPGQTQPACQERGPRLRAGDDALGSNDCGETSSSRAFRHALCVCTDYSAGSRLTTDGFDSSSSDMSPISGGGSIGVDGDIGANGNLIEIGGSLTVAGENGVTLSSGGELRVGQDLEVQGAILGDQASVSVEGDARVGGDVRLGNLSVGKALRMPANTEFRVSENAQISEEKEEPVQVVAPCGCEVKDLFDIASLVQARANDNDNSLLDFDIVELENYTGPITRQLPCGRFYVRRLSGTGRLILSITGRAALYVAEHVDFQDPVVVELDSNAEFDLYLASSMVARGDLTFGSKDNPSRARLFIGGSGTLELQGKNLFCGQVYAPRAELVTTGETEVFGSVFVRRLAPSSQLTIHYDQNPLESGHVCNE
jgi:hypothetical protein